MAAGADRQRVHLISAVTSENGKGRRAFDLQSDLDLLEAKIAEIGDVKLVIIDPISSYLGRKVDSHVNAAVRATLEPVGEIAERFRVAFMSVTHPPKGSTTTAINRFIGSVAFVAAARSAFMVTRDADNEERRLFLPVKNNLAPLGKGLAFWLEQRIVNRQRVSLKFLRSARRRLQRRRYEPLLLLSRPAAAPLHRGDDFNRGLAHVTIPMNSRMTHTLRLSARRPYRRDTISLWVRPDWDPQPSSPVSTS
jgi:hypothetical protein